MSAWSSGQSLILVSGLEAGDTAQRTQYALIAEVARLLLHGYEKQEQVRATISKWLTD